MSTTGKKTIKNTNIWKLNNAGRERRREEERKKTGKKDKTAEESKREAGR